MKNIYIHIHFLDNQKIMDKRKIVLGVLVVIICLTIAKLCHLKYAMPTCEKRLPEVLVIGAPKCGTAALSSFLSHHPDIAIDEKKELNFFSQNYDLGFDWYIDKLPCSAPGQIVIERSSNYIRIEKDVVQRVLALNPKMKLILIVCEPVRRLISQYAMAFDHHKIPNVSFEETYFPNKQEMPKISQFMVNSNYSHAFSSWTRAFPLEQFHIVDGDNLKTKPWEELHYTERFLGVNPYIRNSNFVYRADRGIFCFRDKKTWSTHCLAPGKGRKHPEVSETVKARLRKFYEPYNKIFYKQCGRTFDW